EAELLKPQSGGYPREEGTGSSARGGGAQGTNFSSGALGGPALRPSPSLPGHQLPGTTGRSTEAICANTSPASAHLFLQKLWKVVDSQRFQSIWWGDDGN
uniref:Uncharacterized protein n=1 Tax=Otus sunia TaxID=257818 RepID=A0A8C8AJI1_9STRI